MPRSTQHTVAPIITKALIKLQLLGQLPSEACTRNNMKPEQCNVTSARRVKHCLFWKQGVLRLLSF